MDATMLLTPAEAAQDLGLTPDAVRTMERAGTLPALKTRTGRRLFDARDVQALAAERARRMAER
jgi:excisionase family DNA binding protein